MTTTAEWLAQPTIKRDASGYLSICWADKDVRPVIHVAPELFVEMVAQLNELNFRRQADNRQDDL